MSCDGALDAAVAIGCRIAADAVWQDGRCSWVGAADAADRSRPEYRPVGPLLYEGTAGIALFLAQLAVVTREPGLRRTAIGAVRHAVARGPVSPRDGFHAGTPGIAWAAARVGALLEDDEAREGARTLLPLAPPGPRTDLVSGTAGTIVALLGLASELADPALVRAATDAGEGLLAAAGVKAGQWTWRDADHPRARSLCGVAHGASGVAWALVELFAATGEDRWREAANGAFAYERAQLDERTGTWPDLRRPPRGPAEAMRGTWCYGEAGIALSRLRAIEVLGDGPICSDADIAVQTVRECWTEMAQFAIGDLSLCHGLAGGATALLGAGERESAAALAAVALARHSADEDWPCGVPGVSPGLMRGLSGIGWWLLAVADPTTAPPLLLPGSIDVRQARK